MSQISLSIGERIEVSDDCLLSIECDVHSVDAVCIEIH